MSWLFPMLLVSIAGFAQDGGGDGASKREFSATTGPLLPDQIQGITEILPLSGLRYKPKGWATEFGLYIANSDDVNYNMLSVSFRKDSPMQGFITTFYAGLDSHYYKSAPDASYVSAIGAHLGGGLLAFMGDRVWFRTEMKFHFNPGTSLFIGFGFNFMLSD